MTNTTYTMTSQIGTQTHTTTLTKTNLHNGIHNDTHNKKQIKTNKKQITYHLKIHTLPYTHLHGMTHKHNNSYKIRTEWSTNIIIIKQSFTHKNTFIKDIHIHIQKKHKMKKKKKITRTSVKNKYVTHNKND